MITLRSKMYIINLVLAIEDDEKLIQFDMFVSINIISSQRL